jgi:hypothetical protein
MAAAFSSTSSETIIVAIDDSGVSQRAIDVASKLAAHGETLNFVHAVDTTSVLMAVAEARLSILSRWSLVLVSVTAALRSSASCSTASQIASSRRRRYPLS